MKKVLKPILLTFILLAALTGVAAFFLLDKGGVTDEFAERIKTEQSDQNEDRAYRYDTDKKATALLLSGEEKNVLNFSSQNAYNVAVSKAARERLDRVIKRMDATLENPIIALNPFGTNENTFYFYFETTYRGMIRYTITVADEQISDHVRYVNNGQENNLSRVHEFTVGGLIPGMKNYILIEVLDSAGAMRESHLYKYDVPKSTAPVKIGVQKGKSKEQAENGLFFLLPQRDKNIYTYDNAGILRNVVMTESGHGKRIYQSANSVLYQVSDTKVARVSALGQVTGTVTISGYGPIRDFSYDGYDNVYALVTKNKRDYLLAASFQTGKAKVVYTFPKNVSAGSLTAPKAGSIYISTQNPSGLIKLEAITGKSPKVSFALGNKKAWKKTSLKKKVKGDKTVSRYNMSQATLYLQDSKSDGTNDTMTAYVREGGKGVFVIFTIDGKKKAAEEVENLPVNYAGAGSGESFGEHMILSALGAGTYEEYDGEGKVTSQFSFGAPLTAMTKLTLNAMCFYGG
ncbi:MAG: hypothetical protein J1F22_02000 [Lachnospiraceae bacterium]|nr:hypothetical protein [Lachnospiraceae bacterium]